MSFDSCIATTSGCVVSKRCLSSSTVLLMPFALSLRIFISLCFVLEVFCLFRVWECGDVRSWGGCCWFGLNVSRKE